MDSNKSWHLKKKSSEKALDMNRISRNYLNQIATGYLLRSSLTRSVPLSLIVDVRQSGSLVSRVEWQKMNLFVTSSCLQNQKFVFQDQPAFQRWRYQLRPGSQFLKL
ncbi:hypothetical protein QQ045_006194 [Rhodiola kirilowii]